MDVLLFKESILINARLPDTMPETNAFGGSESTIIIGPSKSILIYALHSLEYVLGLARLFVQKLLYYKRFRGDQTNLSLKVTYLLCQKEFDVLNAFLLYIGLTYFLLKNI